MALGYYLTSPGRPPTSLPWLLALPFPWLAAMLLARTYEERFLWVGVEEYRRVLGAAVAVLAAAGATSWIVDDRLVRACIVLTLLLATVITLLQRRLRRHRLHRERTKGRYQQTTLLVGHRNAVAALDEQMQREVYQGYRVVGCCLPADRQLQAADAFNGLPVLGGLDEVVDVVARYGVDTVAVLPSQELDGGALRRLGWELENTPAELLLAPTLAEVAGPRVHIRPVAGLPLLHMERPELTGTRRLIKECVDRTAALLGLLFLSPVLLAIAAAVRLTSPGPVLFRQERVGLCGESFKMLKYRSMIDGAHEMVEDLEARDAGNDVLFKMREDPRVTRVGRFLRRYSLDELPQLINIIRGEMSLVGPRPPLPSEVELYGVDMRRRFLVKPGLTGLWQVSGRSDLSWDDSVRLDLRYVENWSLILDIMILWRTVRAVLRGAGAY